MEDERVKMVLRDLYLPRELDAQLLRSAEERHMSWGNLVMEFIKQGLGELSNIPPPTRIAPVQLPCQLYDGIAERARRRKVSFDEFVVNLLQAELKGKKR